MEKESMKKTSMISMTHTTEQLIHRPSWPPKLDRSISICQANQATESEWSVTHPSQESPFSGQPKLSLARNSVAEGMGQTSYCFLHCPLWLRADLLAQAESPQADCAPNHAAVGDFVSSTPQGATHTVGRTLYDGALVQVFVEY